MRVASKTRGYTVVEVMIFLAVSGLMFVIAASFISGKQAAGEFRQGTNSVNSQVRGVINDVANGFYPSNHDFTCVAMASDPYYNISSGAANKDLGSNQGCVLMGKVIQFGPAGESSKYNIFTVLGRQYKDAINNSSIPTNFDEAKPHAFYPGSAIIGVDLTERKTLEWGLKVTKVYNATTSQDLSGIGFVSSFGEYNPDPLLGHALTSGSQTINVLGIPGTAIGDGGNPEGLMADGVAGKINSLDANGVIYTLNNPNIVICLKGSNNKYATLTIGGGNGQRLTTTLKVTATNGSCPA